MCRVSESNKLSALIVFCSLALACTQAAVSNNSARPNNQYSSSYQQNDAAAATYFKNNQNQYAQSSRLSGGNQQSYQPPQQQQQQQDVVKEKDVLERFHHRFPDGSYEFRYELTDGTARYERGYFLIYDKIKTLVVVGYYSYRQTDGRYITVFYNADQNGYRQNQSITPQVYPNLPRSIEVPQLHENVDYNTDRPNKGRQ
ncbi:uncharacterized protein LOC120774562 [Bactrocera tryoni]|uniref:uncharacterized protein LOC120774562 n=1 Tax=Bactrocera tryoni TaxID=59916 RepID=UPI001A986F71|nr:uncharacterized protein LOC120774562 [Bactrocera tryoni]